MAVKLNPKGIEDLKMQLALKLYEGCSDGAEILRNNTPIDTKRLWKSTRPMGLSIARDAIRCGVVAGGQSLTGIVRETSIKKNVVYAIYVNNRTGYIDSCMSEIANAIELRLAD